jgi:hypothetical protein
MTTHENVKAKGAMSMLGLLLFLSLAFTLLLSPAELIKTRVFCPLILVSFQAANFSFHLLNS